MAEPRQVIEATRLMNLILRTFFLVPFKPDRRQFSHQKSRPSSFGHPEFDFGYGCRRLE